MNIRLIHRSIVTVLSCCAIIILGGWIGNSTSSPTALNGSPVRYLGIADTVSKWDSTGWTGRVVVGEYETGRGCAAGCRDLDLAVDTLRKRYPTTAFIPLAHHFSMGDRPGINVPIANPADSTERQWGTYIDGHATKECRRNPCWAEEVKIMRATIDSELHRAPEAVLHVEATPQGGNIVTKVQVTSLSSPHSDVYLRMVVIEDTVILKVPDSTIFKKWDTVYKRLNYYNVVRARAVVRDAKYPLGILMHGTGTVSYTFDMAKTQEERLRYRSLAISEPRPQEKVADAGTYDLTAASVFSGKEGWVMDPTRLHVVAFLQDAHTGDVLQAQMVHVNTGPHGELLKLP